MTTRFRHGILAWYLVCSPSPLQVMTYMCVGTCCPSGDCSCLPGTQKELAWCPSCAYVIFFPVRTFINIFSHGDYKNWGSLNVPFSGVWLANLHLIKSWRNVVYIFLKADMSKTMSVNVSICRTMKDEVRDPTIYADESQEWEHPLLTQLYLWKVQIALYQAMKSQSSLSSCSNNPQA